MIRSRFLSVFLLLGALLSFGAAAQKYALKGGRLIDGYGGPPLANSIILVEDGTIQAVGQVGQLEVPEGYTVVSTEGMDVLPGLWESHAHLMLNGHADYSHWQPTYRKRQVDEIMPASAVQLLLAGVTSARDLGANLEDSIKIKQQLEQGDIAGPNLFVSGPFLQYEPYPGSDHYRWGVKTVREAKQKVRQLAKAGVDMIKLVDQDQMELEVAQAIVDTAHENNLKVIGHSHRPDEIRVGLKIGVDNFEHTGLTTAPEYPEDVMKLLKERTATGRVAGGPLFWTPTVEGLYQYPELIKNPERLDNTCWHRGLKPDTIKDIKASLTDPGKLDYMQLTPLRQPTLKRKIAQLREAGVVFLVGTDSGIPTKFHCQSTWNEMVVLNKEMNIPAMDVIRSATYWPAVMMGVQDRLGSITPGKQADIIAVEGDVLRYMNLISDVDFVMKEGVIYRQEGQVIEEVLAPKQRQ